MGRWETGCVVSQWETGCQGIMAMGQSLSISAEEGKEGREGQQSFCLAQKRLGRSVRAST